MTSLYDQMFDDIPLYVVPNTENSEVIEYETNMQRNARLIKEELIRREMEQVQRLSFQLANVGLVGQQQRERFSQTSS